MCPTSSIQPRGSNEIGCCQQCCFKLKLSFYEIIELFLHSFTWVCPGSVLVAKLGISRWKSRYQHEPYLTINRRRFDKKTTRGVNQCHVTNILQFRHEFLTFHFRWHRRICQFSGVVKIFWIGGLSWDLYLLIWDFIYFQSSVPHLHI